MDILSAIGNTSLVKLRKVVPAGCADIFVKLEWENPTGSMKDRTSADKATAWSEARGAAPLGLAQASDAQRPSPMTTRPTHIDSLSHAQERAWRLTISSSAASASESAASAD
jgi:hypothetical protein